MGWAVLIAGAGAFGLFALSARRKERESALRADVLEFVHRLGKSTEGGWIHGGLVIEEFGPRAYNPLRSLVAKGRLEDREGPTEVETLRQRGGRPRYFYRLAGRRRGAN